MSCALPHHEQRGDLMTESKALPIGGRTAECPFAPAPELYEAQEADELRRVKVPSPLLGEFEAVVVARHDDVKTVLVARHRDRPGDNLLAGVVRDFGDQLTDSELAGIGNMLLIAGHETIANTLSASVALLLQHPDQLAVVRDDPSATDGAVEELLRYCAPA